MTLTVKAVDAAKPREKAYKLADAHGLYLFVSPSAECRFEPNPTGQLDLTEPDIGQKMLHLVAFML